MPKHPTHDLVHTLARMRSGQSNASAEMDDRNHPKK